ncbi:MerR family transcriptional regulator [Paenibacillus sacheonensis]|uniref:MerR family transcriptional regulator n=1 Tax=Paenibacillus sacheonensis TaxID=742054 RepID=A0A7X5C247_9BACL|nr:MerR family transcriptional regulator [Paenibacillus sacheonensis]NBC70890.1 MerR family transcriptional regulator [Paenibacillus sacheonensis]
MRYSVKELSALSGVTIKTLHHYHKLGLLPPGEISEAGYRYYGMKELERLQRILFYKTLDFPLAQIKELLAEERDSDTVLRRQRMLLLGRKQRLETVIRTLSNTLESTRRGEVMQVSDMFEGFGSEAEWKAALAEQRDYLKANYGVELTESLPEPAALNEQAQEAARFMSEMAELLRSGAKHRDPRVRELIGGHLAFMQAHGHAAAPDEFAAQTRFFLEDEFHLQMLESQQTGLAYYLHACAASYAAGS